MTLTIKDSLDLGSLTKGEACPDDSRSKPEEHSRSNPVCLEVPVTVRSLPGDKGVGASGSGQPIREESRTVIVFDNGAVLRLSAALPEGQGLIVSNAQGRDVVCRVVHARSLPTVKGYIEIEFVEPVSDFWAIHQPAGRANTAPTTPSLVTPSEPAASPPPPPHAVEPANEIDQDSGSAPTFDDIEALMGMSSAPSQLPKAPEVTARPANLVREKESEFAPNLTESVKPATAVNSAGANFALASSVSPPMKLNSSSSPAQETVAPFRAAPSSVSHDFMSKGLLDHGKGAVTPESSGSNGKKPLAIGVAVLLLVGIAAGAFFVIHGGGSVPANSTPANSAPAAPATAQPATSPSSPSARTQPSQDAAAQFTQVQPVSSASSETPLTEAVSASPEPRAEPRGEARTVPRTDSRAANAAVVKQPEPAATTRRASTNLKLRAPIAAKPNAAVSAEGSAPSIPDAASVAVGAPVSGILPGASRTPSVPSPVRANDTTVEPKLISSAHPDYPAMAKLAHIQGVVVIVAEIDAKGKVGATTVTSGPEVLREAARDAVKRWQYEPAEINGRPVPARVTVSVNFRAE